MEKIRILNVGIKQGESNGRAWRKCGIQTDKHGAKWLSCFLNQRNESRLESLRKGDTVEIIVEEQGQYLNFRLPDRIDYLEERVMALEEKVGMKGEEELASVSGEINEDELPF